MKVKFLDTAQLELDEAVEFCNHEFPGLGNQFLQEVLGAIERIARFPDA